MTEAEAVAVVIEHMAGEQMTAYLTEACPDAWQIVHAMANRPAASAPPVRYCMGCGITSTGPCHDTRCPSRQHPWPEPEWTTDPGAAPSRGFVSG